MKSIKNESTDQFEAISNNISLGFLYTHTSITDNMRKILESTSFIYSLVELLSEKRERQILHAKIKINDRILDLINIHLKSQTPTDILGQKINDYTWKTSSGWAEGFFISSMKRVGQALETRILIDKLFDETESPWIVVCGDFNSEFDEVPVEAIRGRVENTGNGDLAKRIMMPCEMSIPASARFSLYYEGKGRMLDHLLVCRNMLAYYKGSEVHNELIHDESIAFATADKYPESDHAPVIMEFEIPDSV